MKIDCKTFPSETFIVPMFAAGNVAENLDSAGLVQCDIDVTRMFCLNFFRFLIMLNDSEKYRGHG